MEVNQTLEEARAGRGEREEGGDAHGSRAPSRFRSRKSWDDNQVIGALGGIVDGMA